MTLSSHGDRFHDTMFRPDAMMTKITVQDDTGKLQAIRVAWTDLSTLQRTPRYNDMPCNFYSTSTSAMTRQGSAADNGNQSTIQIPPAQDKRDHIVGSRRIRRIASRIKNGIKNRRVCCYHREVG